MRDPTASPAATPMPTYNDGVPRCLRFVEAATRVAACVFVSFTDTLLFVWFAVRRDAGVHRVAELAANGVS